MAEQPAAPARGRMSAFRGTVALWWQEISTRGIPMRFSILAVTTLAAMMTSPAAAQEALKPVQHWGGLIKESGKKSAAPKSKFGVGYLSNQDAFEKLFDAWGLKEKPPKIDFKKQHRRPRSHRHQELPGEAA